MNGHSEKFAVGLEMTKEFMFLDTNIVKTVESQYDRGWCPIVEKQG